MQQGPSIYIRLNREDLRTAAKLTTWEAVDQLVVGVADILQDLYGDTYELVIEHHPGGEHVISVVGTDRDEQIENEVKQAVNGALQLTMSIAPWETRH